MSDNPDKYTPILPFDITYGELYSMYTNMTYYRDRDLCNSIGIRLVSGNVYKQYNLGETPVLVGEQQSDEEEKVQSD